MFEKERVSLKGSDIVFQRYEIDFYDFHTYCCNFTTNGDWVIALGSEQATKGRYEEKFDNDDSEKFMEEFDGGLLKVYRHQDDSLVRKNVKMLGDRKNPKKKGLYYNILMAIEKADRILSKIPNGTLTFACDFIRKVYDDRMKDPITGQQIETHIWIPIWRTTGEKGFLISILGRINLIIT